MYPNYYRKYLIKSAIIITFLLLFAILSTYFIYNKFSKLRETDIDTGELEVVFHDKNGNFVNITRFNPVSDAVGLSSMAYNFTVKNGTDKDVSYKIILEDNLEQILMDSCQETQIPKELLKISLRKDHEAPNAYILSELEDNVIFEDTLESDSEEEYSIRVWSINTNFLVDKNSHFHAIIKVVEEGE